MIKLSHEPVGKEYIIENIEKELMSLEVSSIFQEKLKAQTLEYLKTFMNENSDSSSLSVNKISKYLNDTSIILNKSASNIEIYNNLKNRLNNIKQEINSDESFNIGSVNSKVKDYNQYFTKNQNQISSVTNEIQDFLSKCMHDEIARELLVKKSCEEVSTSNNANQDDSEKISSDLTVPENENIQENTLIISEKNNNVVLPYTLKNLQEILEKNPGKYADIQDIIEREYTKPIKYYKNSSIARFKETFKLVRKRSNGSFKRALDLSLEALFNYDLHPAIISACKNVDELDIYLSCLEYDELEDFKFFKIIFDIMPTVIKNNRSIYKNKKIN